MGLHLCYDIGLPRDCAEDDVIERMQALRARASTLPFDEVSELVRFDEHDIAQWRPLRGLAFESLEHVVHCSAHLDRETLYRESLGLDEDDEYEVVDDHTKIYHSVVVPTDLPTSVVGFAVAPAAHSEPATFALTRLHGSTIIGWRGHCCCKTQYASVLGDENLIRCHGSLVLLLDIARMLGFEIDVRDQTGYWESRDPRTLIDAVAKMNRIVARLAGVFTDAMREATGDSAQVGGAIFDHPDFERLETDARTSDD